MFLSKAQARDPGVPKTPSKFQGTEGGYLLLSACSGLVSKYAYTYKFLCLYMYIYLYLYLIYIYTYILCKVEERVIQFGFCLSGLQDACKCAHKLWFFCKRLSLGVPTGLADHWSRAVWIWDHRTLSRSHAFGFGFGLGVFSLVSNHASRIQHGSRQSHDVVGNYMWNCAHRGPREKLKRCRSCQSHDERLQTCHYQRRGIRIPGCFPCELSP